MDQQHRGSRAGVPVLQPVPVPQVGLLVVRGGGERELQLVVPLGAGAEQDLVPQVVLPHVPGAVGTLAGEQVRTALDVPRGEVDERAQPGPGSRVPGRHGHRTRAVHAVQHAVEVLRHEVHTQRPRGVGVADGEGHVGHSVQHHAPVAHVLGGIHGLTVHHEVRVPEELHVESRGGHDHVRVQMAPGCQLDPVRREALDGVRHDLGVLPADGAEEVPVRCGAQPLVPRVVLRREVLVHREGGAQVLHRTAVQQLAHGLRAASAELVDRHAAGDVAPAVGRAGQAGRQAASQPDARLVPARHRGHVRGRALEHAHPGAAVHERGDQGDGRGAAADDHHTLAGHVQVLGPVLGVDDRAPELGEGGPVRCEALVVAVVAGGHEEPPPAQPGHLPRVDVLVRHGPGVGVGGPLGPQRTLPEPDVPQDAGLLGGRTDVLQDGVPRGQAALTRPRAAAVAERGHVRVGADAGVAEEVPGPADVVPCLQDGHGAARPGQFPRGPDAGDPRADDDDVDLVRAHAVLQLPVLWCATTPRRVGPAPRLRGGLGEHRPVTRSHPPNWSLTMGTNTR